MIRVMWAAVFLVSVVAAAGLPSPGLAHVVGQGVPKDRVEPRVCQEFVAFPDVPLDKARALIPQEHQDRYVVPRDLFGTLENPGADTAKLFISARRCDALVFIRDGETKVDHDVVESYIQVSIEPPGDAPHASGFSPAIPGIYPPPSAVPVENYLVQWVTNSELRAKWLREKTHLGDAVKVIHDLVFELTSRPTLLPGFLDLDLAVEVPKPAPSAYIISAQVSTPSGPEWVGNQNQWWETPNGILIIFAGAPRVLFGTAPRHDHLH